MQNESACLQSVMTAVQEMTQRESLLTARLQKEATMRRALLNKVIDLQGNIRVFCRARPLNSAELAQGDVSIAEVEQEDDCITIGATPATALNFDFDRVFGLSSTQAQVFADVAPFVESSINGFNVCIFAYGQTGSGKTYTMEGPASDRGVNYRAIEQLFLHVAERQASHEYTVSVSVVEVYNEILRDLLVTKNKGACVFCNEVIK